MKARSVMEVGLFMGYLGVQARNVLISSLSGEVSNTLVYVPFRGRKAGSGSCCKRRKTPAYILFRGVCARDGGYLRIVKAVWRVGDNALMVVVEFVKFIKQDAAGFTVWKTIGLISLFLLDITA